MILGIFAGTLAVRKERNLLPTEKPSLAPGGRIGKLTKHTTGTGPRAKDFARDLKGK